MKSDYEERKKYLLAISQREALGPQKSWNKTRFQCVN